MKMAALPFKKLLFVTRTRVCFSKNFHLFQLSHENTSSLFNKIVFVSNSSFIKENIRMSTGPRFIYPEAKRLENVVDMYFETSVKDPYRWLEDPDSQETQEFVKNQNILTRQFLDACPYYAEVNSALKKMWDYPKYSCPSKEGNKYFFYKNTGLQNQSVLYVMDDLNSEPSVFLDPNTLSQDGTVALSVTQFSEDGSIFAYGLSSSGSDWMTIQFKNVHTNENYPEKLEKVKFSTIAWTHDNKGIFYGCYPEVSKFTNIEISSDENQKLFYHKVGTDQSEDILVLEFPSEPKFRISSEVSHCGRYLVITLQKGCRDNLVYFCDLQKIKYNIQGKLPIMEVVGQLNADYEYVTNNGSEFIFKTNKNAPNSRLIKIDFEKPEEANWVTLVPEHQMEVLDWAVCVNTNRLILCYIHHVADVLQYHELSNGRLIHKFNMERGNIVGFSGKKKLSEIFFKLTNFLTPGIIYRCELSTGNYICEIYKEVKPKGFEREQFETDQVFYNSKDGTKIPMFLVHKRVLERDQNTPCLLYGYGGFNISIKPFFSVTMSIFLNHCRGILAVPNIRGGGEYGEKWHNQGRFEKKQNTFDDFQAAAEYLISNNYTSSKYLIIKGDSNGGLLVSACAIQRPDLFGAVLCGVGVMDMLRFQKFTIGSAWVSDYGSSDVHSQFEYLFKYSPLHNIKIPADPAVQFPAMLLTTGDHDDRVVPLHSLKFIAAIQHAVQNCAKQTNPLLVRIDTKTGHGSGKPTSKLIEEATDTLCFILQALSIKFY